MPSRAYRYSLKEYADGIEGDEGTFNICAFWLVEAMTSAGREDRSWLEEARLVSGWSRAGFTDSSETRCTSAFC